MIFPDKFSGAVRGAYNRCIEAGRGDIANLYVHQAQVALIYLGSADWEGAAGDIRWRGYSGVGNNFALHSHGTPLGPLDREIRRMYGIAKDLKGCHAGTHVMLTGLAQLALLDGQRISCWAKPGYSLGSAQGDTP